MGFITNAAAAVETLTDWLAARLEASGREEYVLGLSGGIDSALAALLAVRAVGRDRLLCVLMPYKTSAVDSLADARALAEQLGVRHQIVDITPLAEAYERQITDVTPLRRGNLCARLRMLTLFDQSHACGLVLGTSNKTEILLGYGTLFGDAAWSVNPLGDLYKTDVRLLSQYLDAPAAIQRKIPTADLWRGQTDEADLGYSYADIDALLVKLIDEKKSRAELLAAGVDPQFLERIVSLIRGSAFKRAPALVAWLKLPYSTAQIEDPRW